jgi:hypothetical protein
MADSMTVLLRSGSPGTKRNLAIVGDGFTASDQAVFDTYVRERVMDGVFGQDYFYEDAQAFNAYRVNLESAQSGVTTHTYDAAGVRTSVTNRDTVLGTIYTGSWDRCWMEDGPNTISRLNSHLSRWVPDWDFVLIVLNTPSSGGCRRGNRLYVTRGTSAAVVAHEFGHGFGSLADEYCRSGTHSGTEPGEVNVTANTNTATLKWRRFVRASTPVPTGVKTTGAAGQCTGYTAGPRPAGWDSASDVGLFEGAKYMDRGRYRPVENCRMRGNSPPFCPVCYTELKRIHHPVTGRSFERVYTGDTNGDGRDEVVIHNTNGLQIYSAGPAGNRLDLTFSAVERVPGSWQFAAGDQFHVGDVDGDGRDELVVLNTTNWVRPYLGILADDGAGALRLIRRYDGAIGGWTMSRSDRIQLADFTGDGRQDVLITNGGDGGTTSVGMLRSSPPNLQLVRRYDGVLAGWHQRPGDQLYPADIDGSGRKGLYVFNGTNWSVRYLAMFRSTGSAYQMVRRYDDVAAGWNMRQKDRFVVGDFDADGREDLYVFNGENWSMAYLAMLRSTGSALTMVRRYDGSAPGWQMRKRDQHFAADLNGDGRTDLFVWNPDDWSKEYLGTMVSNGNALSCSWREDWVGEWNLGAVDRFQVCNVDGVAARRNLIVHNRDWLGMMRATPTLSLRRIYHKWIHNYRHGRNW